MQTPHWALFLTGSVFSFFSRFAFCYDESPWQPVLYDYYHIDLGELGGHNDNDHHGAAKPDRGGFGGKVPIPRDAIVDVINELGVKLLAIHNEHNENNIAISPYGAFSVLAALSEGLQGDSAHEILHAAHIPNDKHIIRVGLRDIHRHLKSYFIPEEGFLAGLTLNLNNVSLRSEYEDVLHFYGFDYGSFNNALYPEPLTTKRPTEGTTLETGLGTSKDPAIATTQRIEDTTTEVLTRLGGPSSEKSVTITTTESPKTTTSLITMENKETTIMTTQQESTTQIETTAATMTTTTTSTETITENTSIPNTEPTTTNSLKTTVKELLQTSGTSAEKTDFVKISTILKESSTEAMSTTTIESTTVTSTKPLETTTFLTTTAIPLTTTSSEATIGTVETTMTNGNTLRTTRQVYSENQLTTAVSAQTITIATDAFPSTQTEALTTMGPLEDDNTVSTVAINETDFLNSSTQVKDQTLEDLETTTSFSFETTSDYQDMTTPQNQNNLDFNYNYESHNVPPAYAANMVNDNTMPNPPQRAGFSDNIKRSARSIVDYVIARFYDDRRPYVVPPQRPLYVPQEPLSFAVYGKYRESGVNFMKYDTVLPYFFVQNLNALALSFPLDSTRYYLLLLLPLQDNGVDQLICDLRLHGNLRYIIDNLRLTHVVATIPSFMLKGYVTLTPALQRLGIRKIFEPRQADFSPMTNVTDIYVTNIEQAVTVTIRNYLDPSAERYKHFRQYPPVHFKADHPFLYFVIDSELHVALMVGKVINPLNSRVR